MSAGHPGSVTSVAYPAYTDEDRESGRLRFKGLLRSRSVDETPHWRTAISHNQLLALDRDSGGGVRNCRVQVRSSYFLNSGLESPA